MGNKTQVNPAVNAGVVGSFRKFFSGYSVIVVTIIIFIVASIFQGSNFLSAANIINVLRNNAVLGILALGMAFVIIVGEIDLSVGSQLVAVGAICLGVLNRTNNVVLAVIVAIGCAVGFSACMGLIVAKGNVPSFVVTLGFMYIYRSVCQYFMDGGGFYGKVGAFSKISNSSLGPIPMPIIYLFIVFIVYFYISRYTKTGRHIYSVGSNARASKLSGISVSKVKVCAFIIMGASVGIAAVIEASRMNSINASSSGNSYEMYAIAMAVIGGVSMKGGRGKMVCVLFGIFILAIVNNFLNLMGVSAFLVNAIKGAIIIVAVLLQKKDEI
ncbi:Ribose transport system permease protein rbsC [uncultured Roseburia sp.]|uniref:ABC transporter permease n=1 Tax=Brotonthovivens ammoniilytica TaxID=2981725 RepID=A0ABT2TL02_9FIRM|nr:ABC transporter permease [Brotonthovivens ammoniilytica]MCU6762792.1 ABC transporter permease [Brotonthovivens ammoniilytica]SCI89091.1 Ribose transport system permease protein rbsC [uncultured Roseburia sp.]